MYVMVREVQGEVQGLAVIIIHRMMKYIFVGCVTHTTLKQKVWIHN